jgi:hypothetical protein
MVEKPNRAPDWRVWHNLPTARLHEAVALSLNIDPKRLDWSPNYLSGGRQFREGIEFDDRMFVARRCLGETLPGPENRWAVHSDDADPIVMLRDFAAWAVSVGWTLPAELSGLAADPQSAFPVAAPDATTHATGAKASKVDLKDDLRPIPNNRGSPGVKMNEAVTAMVDAVKKDNIPFSTLRRMKQKELNVFRKDAGRTTLASARVQALTQLSQQGYSDKDPTEYRQTTIRQHPFSLRMSWP